MVSYYKGTALDIFNLVSFFRKKLVADENEGLEFNLQTGELFFVTESGQKELIVKLELSGLAQINQVNYSITLTNEELFILQRGQGLIYDLPPINLSEVQLTIKKKEGT